MLLLDPVVVMADQMAESWLINLNDVNDLGSVNGNWSSLILVKQ